jgi:hypothetical protein
VTETDWKETRLEPSPCPYCGKMNDAASAPGEQAPRPGDLGVCLTCASPLIYDDNLRTRALTEDDWRELTEENKEELRQYQRAVRSIDRRPEAERKATAAAARPRAERRRASRYVAGRGRP